MDFVRAREVFHFVDGQLDRGRKTVIANHNIHSLALASRIPKLRAFYASADLIEVDSTPVIFWARLMGFDARPFHRCTYLDWRNEFWEMARAKGWRVFFLGCAPGVIDRAMETVRERHPGVELEGRHGYFDATKGSADNAAVLEEIIAYRPDVLLVGMGMPRQELWVHENLASLPTSAVFTVGGAFDYEAGVQAPAPRWLARIGFEWLFRLVTNPRRMFFRYCIEPFYLVPALVDDVREARRRSRRRQLL
jgi:N-acetylglucosaminyldiphosphoundecaprenol N-acetyl-beta-D-mannosaminyltransferase